MDWKYGIPKMMDWKYGIPKIMYWKYGIPKMMYCSPNCQMVGFCSSWCKGYFTALNTLSVNSVLCPTKLLIIVIILE